MSEYFYTYSQFISNIKNNNLQLEENDTVTVTQLHENNKKSIEYKVLKNIFFKGHNIQHYQNKNKLAYIILDKFEINDTSITFEANFDYWVFLGTVEIKNVEFFIKTSFNHSIFYKKCDFENITFNQEVLFQPSIFYGETYFDNIIFMDRVSFNMSHFKKSCFFRTCEFHNLAEFSNIFFAGETYFYFSSFNKKTIFMYTCFFKQTHYLLNNFTDELNYEHAFFIGKVNFQKTNLHTCIFLNTFFSDYLIFDNIQVENKITLRISEVELLNKQARHITQIAQKSDIKITIENPLNFNFKIDFDKIIIKGKIEIFNYSLINSFFNNVDMTCFIFFNVIWPIKNNRVAFNDENDESNTAFEDIYMQLKTKYYGLQNYNLSNLFHASELEMRRRNKIKNSKLPFFLRYINFEGLYYLISKYGLSWLTPLIFILIIYILFISIFSFIYFPIIHENFSDINYDVLKNTSTLLLKNLFLIIDNTLINKYVNNGHTWFSFFLKIHQIITYFLLMMTVFAIKRKFINK